MVISEMLFPVNHLTGTSKTEPNYNQIQLTTPKKQTISKKLQTYTHTKPNKTKPGLGASYTIRPGNGVGLFYISQTHTGLLNSQTSHNIPESNMLKSA